MTEYTFKPKGVCARNIQFELDNGRIHNLRFTGGCNGNLKAIGKLLEGQDASTAAAILEGNDCGGRGTSCADQLSIALKEAISAQAN